MSLARSWLHNCMQAHKICPKPTGKFMPTRILAISGVGESTHLRLLENPYPEPYVTLSYCWGDKQQLTTTTSNIQRHTTDVNFLDLPATVKDAITVSIGLEIRRLWVDSLCIIQDDDDDKAREISQMPLIYSQSTVTIVASRASGVYQGFLQERITPTYTRPAFELPYRCIGGEIGTAVLLPYWYTPEEAHQPLESRGWALQERLLSPRVLEYRSLHTRWVCQDSQSRVGDERTDGFVNRNRLYGDASLSSQAPAAALSIECLPILDSKEFGSHITLWYDIVKLYTQLVLTVSSDRILAISGIASRFQAIFDDDYCAGLWKANLSRELLWNMDESPYRRLEPRPEYQGPSWSWVSVNGGVYFDYSTSKWRKEQVDDYFEILDCQLQLRGGDESFGRFGAVESGALLIKGRVQQAILARPRTCWSTILHRLVRKVDSEDQSGILDSLGLRLDAHVEFTTVDFIPIFLLKVTNHNPTTPSCRGLILRQEREFVYSRLGVFSFDYDRIPEQLGETSVTHKRLQHVQELGWLDEGAIRTITLV